MLEQEMPFRQDRLPVATILHARDLLARAVRAASVPSIHISATRAALSRVVGQGLRAKLAAVDATLTVCLGGSASFSIWPSSLTLSGPDGDLELDDGARVLRILTGIDFEPSDDSDMEWLQSAVLGRLIGTPFASCLRIANKASLLSRDSEILRLELRSDCHFVATHLRADAGSLMTFLARGGWSAVKQPLSAYASLPLHLGVRVGTHTLTSTQLHSLSIGDVLLPESTSFGVTGEGWIAIGGAHIRVRYSAPGTLTVLDVVDRSQLTRDDGATGKRTGWMQEDAAINKGGKMEMDHDQYDDERASELADHAEENSAGEKSDADESSQLDTVSVTLHFVLGKVRTILGDIRTLAPGSILLFGGGSPESVSIVSSGRTLGRGEIVDVDGRLGIRITQWGHEGE